MIRRITGTLVGVVEGREPIVEVELPGSGVVLEALVPRYLADRLGAGPRGGVLTLHTRVSLETTTQGASFQPRLVGFESDHHRRFFELMTGVKGMGTRKALRAMTIEPAAIAAAVAADDTKALEKLPEIGKRLAQTIVAELSGKVDAFLTEGERRDLEAASAIREHKRRPPVVEEAIEALVALGEGRADAERKVDMALGGRTPDAFASANELVAAAFGR